MDSPNTETQSWTRYDTFIFLIIALLALLGLILLTPTGLNLDSTMYLEIGQYLLEGRLPYVDYVELNPPLIHYINVIPVFLANLSGLNPIFVYKLLIFVIVLYSVFMTRHLVFKLTDEAYSLETNIISIIIIILTIEIHGGSSNFADFGQREHILSLFIIPWIILRLLKAMNISVSISQSIMIGIFAAIGIALKPYFVLPLLVIELYLLFKYRNWRAIFSSDVWAFVVIGVLYLGHFFILPPAVSDNFFNNLIPSVGQNYDVYSIGSMKKIIVKFLLYPHLFGPRIIWIIGLGIGIVIPRKQDNHISGLFVIFTLFTIGSIAGFLMQGIGFRYQALPYYFTIFSAIMIRIQPHTGQSNALLVNKLQNMFLLVLIILVTGHTGFRNSVTFNLSSTDVSNYLLSESESEDSIFFVDTNIMPTFPLLVQIDRRSRMTYPVAFPIAFGLYQHENPETLYDDNAVLPEEIESYLSILASDIETYQPTLILIHQDNCLACPDNFNIHRMLLANGFIDTYILPDYVVDDAPSITDFIIYKRQ